MALIKCPECARDVSTSAAACPGCGAPVSAAQAAPIATPAKKAPDGMKFVKALALIIGGTFVVVWLQIRSADHAEALASSAQPAAATLSRPSAPPAGPPIAMNALRLATEYHDNELAADARYKGKRIAISGTVKSIAKDFADDPYVTLATDNEFMAVQVSFKKGGTDEADLAKLHPGDNITVTCVGKGMVMGSPMLSCS